MYLALDSSRGVSLGCGEAMAVSSASERFIFLCFFRDGIPLVGVFGEPVAALLDIALVVGAIASCVGHVLRVLYGF